MEKIYVVFSGRRDGSWGTNNEFERDIEKAFTTKAKAELWVLEQCGIAVDEDGRAKYNEQNFPHNDHDDIDYDFYDIIECDLE